MITLNARMFTRKMGIESWCCDSAGMKNVGRCQAHQITPRMRAAASGRRRWSRRGRAKPAAHVHEAAGIGDEGEGQKVEEPVPRGKAREEVGSQEPSGDQIQCGEADQDGGVPRQSGPARNDAGEQAADTGPAAGACCHDDASDGRAEGGQEVERV